MFGLFGGGGGFGGGMFAPRPLPIAPGMTGMGNAMGMFGSRPPPVVPIAPTNPLLPGQSMVPRSAVPNVKPGMVPETGMPLQYRGGPGLSANPVVNFSPVDMDALTRTVYGEARGEPPLGQLGVANVAINRAQQTGAPVSSVVNKPHQFAPYKGKIPASEAQRIQNNIAPALYGMDVTGGADHFYSPKNMNGAPAWAKNVDPTATIGGHKFYSLNPQSLPPIQTAQTMPLGDLFKAPEGPSATIPVSPPPPVTPAPNINLPGTSPLGAPAQMIPNDPGTLANAPGALPQMQQLVPPPTVPGPTPRPVPTQTVPLSQAPGNLGGPPMPTRRPSPVPPMPSPNPINNPAQSGPLPNPMRTGEISAPVQAAATYALQKGENPWVISKRLGIPFDVLMELNPMTNAQSRRLPIGYNLNLPSGY